MICDAPGCTEETKGRVSLFADGWDGGLAAHLCIAHLFGLVNAWPTILNVLAGKPADGG